jgi:hypothetical protein
MELARLAEEQFFQYYHHLAMLFRGIILVEQGSVEKGEHLALTASTALRQERASEGRPFILSFLAEVFRKTGRLEEGLHFVNRGIRLASDGEDMQSEAELYRLKGELTLQQSRTSQDMSQTSQDKSEDTDPRPLTPDPQGEAEACFLKAIAIARKQQAKSLELRAVMSLVRLRQQQALEDEARPTQHETRTMLDEAHQMLSEVYNWFTEGFDTKDLQEAKALLEELSH